MMQTDVLASNTITSTGNLKEATGTNNLGRCRIRGVYIVAGASAGSVTLKDGGVSGTLKLTLNSVGSATAAQYFLLPGEGILFGTDVYATITNAASVMVFYA
jgi:hypothetical protein